MKIFILAIVIGVAAEAVLVALLAAGGIGPCGPASPVGALVLILHAPGLSLASSLHIREPLSLAVVGAAYAALWTGIALLIISGFSKRGP